jgi:outer membrane protein insertion porin family
VFSKQGTIRNLTLLLLLFLLAEPAHSQVVAPGVPQIDLSNPLNSRPRQFTIRSINLIGTESYSVSMISGTTGLQVGESITIPGEMIATAVKRLYNTGLFSDVSVVHTEISTGSVDLDIYVTEQPRLEDYELRGIKRSHRRDLREQITLLPGFAVTESSKMQAVNTIHRYYREKGYWYTNVDVIDGEVDTLRNRMKVIFDIDPGERIQIRTVEIDGNESFSDRKLRSQMKPIKRTTFWRSLTRQTFERDDYLEGKQNLINFYKKNGHLDFRIKEDTVYVYDHNRRRQGVAINLTIEEGPQYRVRNITWEGNTVYPSEVLNESLGFEKGDVFNQEKFEMNLNINRESSDVTSLYQNIGYLFMRIEQDIRFVQGDSIDIHLNIIEDEIAELVEVSFTGNTKTNDDVVRRNLRNIPGTNYSRAAIQRSVRELATLGYFVPENILPDLDYNYEEKTVNVIYSLDESASTDNFEFSGGFGGRQIGVILSARLNFNNFSAQNLLNGEAWRPLPSGDGQKLSLGVQVTGRGFQNYSIGFQEPWMFGRPNSFGFNTSYSFYKFSNQRFEQFSSSVSLGRRLQWPDDFFQQINILQYQMFDVFRSEGLLEPGRASMISLKSIVERNSLDNPLSPNNGSKLSLSLEVAPPLPGFKQFYKGLLTFQNHIPIVGKLVATSGAEFGYMGWLGSKDRSQFQRFYLGGTPLQQQQVFYRDNVDLKGYPGGFGGSISPAIDGEFVGGRIYNKYFAEIRYPAVSSEQVQLIPYVFAETGNAYLDFNTWDPFNLKRAAGFGVRVFLPILGLIDLSYGYRFDGIPNTTVQPGNWEFLINIGSPF